jgi:hypothetical protein
VSTDLEAELRAAFAYATESLQPPSDLASRVRRSSRRRSMIAAAGAVAVILVTFAGLSGGLGTWGSRAPEPGASHHGATSRPVARTRIAIAAGEGVVGLAAAGHYLYIATEYAGDPPYQLSAYDRETGRLIRRVSVPSEPAALQVGPGGSVWLTFYADQNGGPTGTWLLSANLARRSAARFGSADVLPTGSDTALLASQHALTAITMPPPGTAGQVTAHADPADKINGQLAVGTLTPIAGRVAAQVTDGDGGHSHLVIAGQPALTFGGRPDQQVGYVAAEDDGLWVTTGTNSDPNVGPLARLSPALRVITPPAVKTNPILRQSEQVWTEARTVWVATAAPHRALLCFTYRGRVGPIATIPLRGEPIGLATVGDTAYVTLATGTVGVTSGVLGFAIPRACR